MTPRLFVGALAAAAGTAVVAGSLVSPGAGTLLQATAGAAAPPGQVKKSPAPAEPPPKALTIRPDPLVVTGLAPGISQTHTVQVDNPNTQDVVLRSVTAVVTGPTPTGCAVPDDLEVLVAPTDPVEIRRGRSHPVAVVLRLHNSSTRDQNACRGQTFSFSLAAVATSK